VTARVLVLLTGPVGGGKSTTAAALAGRLRASGRPSSVIDLDLLYAMAQQDGPLYVDLATWKIAYRSAAALADVFFASGLDVVIVGGGFFNQEERRWLCDFLTSDVSVELVAIAVSWEETARRVDADPSADRVATRIPQVLRSHHDLFTRALPFLRDHGVVIDADHRPAYEVASAIHDAIFPSKESRSVEP
jgi:shikimate kinase